MIPETPPFPDGWQSVEQWIECGGMFPCDPPPTFVKFRPPRWLSEPRHIDEFA